MPGVVMVRTSVQISDFYSIYGCTVAYFCNLSGFSDTRWASDGQSAAADITSTCGEYPAGWDTYDHPNNALYYSYGREDYCEQGHAFCDRGTSG